MNKRILALALSGSLLLSGCTAMLERSYEVAVPHEIRPATAEDDSYVRVENYRELVTAVLYQVSQREEEGVIRLYDYSGDVEEDLARACLEVAVQDPLGAYAVEYIKHEYTRVVSYYQATVSVRYRRTAEQMNSIVRVTGTTAIRSRVGAALADFAPEVVLRVAYFAGDEASLAQLVRQAYYDAPETALGMPEVKISLYPDAGRDRVLEIELNYGQTPAQLRERERRMQELAEELALSLWDQAAAHGAPAVAAALGEAVRWEAEGGSTAYDALTQGCADSEGMALAMALLCQRLGLACEVQEGTLRDQRWLWNVIQDEEGQRRYLDVTEGDGTLYSDEELAARGYRWPGAPQTEAEE